MIDPKFIPYYKAIGRCNALIWRYNDIARKNQGMAIMDFSIKHSQLGPINRTSYESIFTVYFYLLEAINESLRFLREEQVITLAFMRDYLKGAKIFTNIPRSRKENIQWKFIESPMRD